MVKFSRTCCQRLLACWGNGDFGRLGHGKSSLGESIPRVCSYLSDLNIAHASCGGAHTVAVSGNMHACAKLQEGLRLIVKQHGLADDGSVFSMGLNEDGQLGHSAHARSVPVPQEVLLPEPVVKIAAGHHHTLFLTQSGHVWACGSNKRGQLGLGSKAGSHASTPQLLKAFTGANIVSIAAGAEHSLAVSASGQLFSWGCGSNGRLGHAQSSNRLWFWNRDESTPRLVQSMPEKAVGVSCGHMHSGCVDVHGNAYVWGYGSYWQLGAGKTLDAGLPQQVAGVHSVTGLALGGAHTLAVRQTDDLMAWGANQNGVLGLGIATSQDACTPVKVPKLQCSQVSTGWKHSAAVGLHGELYAWGWGGSVGTATSYERGRSSGGQLGLGDEFDYWAPTQITDLQTAIQDKQPPLQEFVKPAAQWTALQVSCGFNHTAAVVQIDNS